jgi:hypothetical protein
VSGRPARAAAVGIAAVDSALAAAGTRGQRGRWVTKPAVVPAIALAVRSGGGQPSRTLGTALAASWAGDMALLSRSDAGLLGGVAGSRSRTSPTWRRSAAAAPGAGRRGRGIRAVRRAGGGQPVRPSTAARRRRRRDGDVRGGQALLAAALAERVS